MQQTALKIRKLAWRTTMTKSSKNACRRRSLKYTLTAFSGKTIPLGRGHLMSALRQPGSLQVLAADIRPELVLNT